jgi:hypothetical protein
LYTSKRARAKIAKTPQEAVQLVELGFEYVTGEYTDGGKLFKKKKLLYFTPTSGLAGS